MIIKSYEIQCNTCGCADHFFDTKYAANQDYKEGGGIVKGEKHYCDVSCKEKAKRKKGKNEDR